MRKEYKWIRNLTPAVTHLRRTMLAIPFFIEQDKYKIILKNKYLKYVFSNIPIKVSSIDTIK